MMFAIYCFWIYTIFMESDSFCEEVEIPIWVSNKQKWLTGLTRHTTCDDVIYALLYNDNKSDDDSKNYAIFEQWKDVERPLPRRTRILKIWQSWGADQHHVTLSLKLIDDVSLYGEVSNRSKRRKRSKSLRETRHTCSCPQCFKKEMYNSAHARNIDEMLALISSQEKDIQLLYRKIHRIDNELNFLDKSKPKKDHIVATSINDNSNSDIFHPLISLLDENIDPTEKENILVGICKNDQLTFLEQCEKTIEIDSQLGDVNKTIEDLYECLLEETHKHKNMTTQETTNKNKGENLKFELSQVISRGVALAVDLQEAARCTKVAELNKSLREKVIFQLEKELGDLNTSQDNNAQNSKLTLKLTDGDMCVSENGILQRVLKYHDNMEFNNQRLSNTGDHLSSNYSENQPISETKIYKMQRECTSQNLHNMNTVPCSDIDSLNTVYDSNIRCVAEKSLDGWPCQTKIDNSQNIGSNQFERGEYCTSEKTIITNADKSTVPLKKSKIIKIIKSKYPTKIEKHSQKHDNFIPSTFSPPEDPLCILQASEKFKNDSTSSAAKSESLCLENEDSNSDTGLSSMNSEDITTRGLETLV